MQKSQGILDTINTNPVYTSHIPSTGKKFKYRGYTTGEEQALLVAKESDDADIILENIKKTISACTFDEVDPNLIATFDIEYLLLLLRSKSVGEMIDLSLKCENCDKTNDVSINIEDIKKPEILKDFNVVKLNDEVSVIMKYPGFDILEKMSSPDSDVFSIVASLVTQVVKGDLVIETSELDPNEVVRFIKGMNSKTTNKLTKFVYDTPTIKHVCNIKCIHCEHQNEYLFKGIKNFFV